MNDVATLLRQKRSQFDQKLGEARAIKRRQSELEKEVEALGLEVSNYDKALAIFHGLSSVVQEHFTQAIEDLISEGLTSVFETNLRFKITSDVKGGQSVLDFTILNDDGTETDILDARGGGLSALCGVLLRIVILRLMNDRIRQILILDEPLSHLSAAYVPAAGELLRRLSDELDIQIIMVTHQPEFADHGTDVYELSSGDTNVKIRRL
jgi:DNA repair exonuclease SbcCD ATPase subunit